MNHKNQRVSFGSRLGVVLATVGCAVGLGNIWRFPYMVGQNGGAAFLLIYACCIVLLGLPVMITEFSIGKHTHRNAAGAFKVMAPNTKWKFLGYNGVLAAFLIMGFYMVVAGWTLEYIFKPMIPHHGLKTPDEFVSEFALFSTSVVRPIVCTLLFIIATHIIIVFGVKKGIERASKILMPMLFVLLVVLCVRSVTLDKASEGLSFLFNPDFSKINSSVVLSAMGQAFFSLSIGMGCLITYASYFDKSTNLQRTALQVSIIDSLVAILAGIMIFPAVFSFGIQPTAGPELVFITLPNVFAQMPLGWLWSKVFFVLLALAALTSTISLHEVATAYVHEEMHLSRSKAALLVSLGVAVLAVLSSLSLGVLKEYTLGGLTFFDALDFLTAKIMMPFGGMLICIFMGWRVKQSIWVEELTNGGRIRFYFLKTYIFFVRYLAPICIGLIFLNELGLIHWS